MVTTGLFLVYVFRKPLLCKIVTSYLEETVRKETGRRIRIQSIGGNWLNNIRLENIRLMKEGAGNDLLERFETELAEISYSLWNLLLSRNDWLKGIRVKGLDLALDVAKKTFHKAKPGEPFKIPGVFYSNIRLDIGIKKLSVKTGNGPLSVEKARIRLDDTGEGEITAENAILSNHSLLNGPIEIYFRKKGLKIESLKGRLLGLEIKKSSANLESLPSRADFFLEIRNVREGPSQALAVAGKYKGGVTDLDIKAVEYDGLRAFGSGRIGSRGCWNLFLSIPMKGKVCPSFLGSLCLQARGKVSIALKGRGSRLATAKAQADLASLILQGIPPISGAKISMETDGDFNTKANARGRILDGSFQANGRAYLKGNPLYHLELQLRDIRINGTRVDAYLSTRGKGMMGASVLGMVAKIAEKPAIVLSFDHLVSEKVALALRRMEILGPGIDLVSRSFLSLSFPSRTISIPGLAFAIEGMKSSLELGGRLDLEKKGFSLALDSKVFIDDLNRFPPFLSFNISKKMDVIGKGRYLLAKAFVKGDELEVSLEKDDERVLSCNLVRFPCNHGMALGIDSAFLSSMGEIYARGLLTLPGMHFRGLIQMPVARPGNFSGLPLKGTMGVCIGFTEIPFFDIDFSSLSYKGRRGLKLQGSVSGSGIANKVHFLARATDKKGTTARASGVVFIPGIESIRPGPELLDKFREWRIKSAFQLDSGELSMLKPFFPSIAGCGGRLGINGKVRGSLSSPRISTEVRVDDAFLKLKSRGPVFDHIRLRAFLAGNSLEVKELGLAMGRGHIKANGRIDGPLHDPSFNFHITGKNIKIIEKTGTRLRASGDLTLDGDARSPRLKGLVILQDGRLKKHISLLSLGIEKAGEFAGEIPFLVSPNDFVPFPGSRPVGRPIFSITHPIGKRMKLDIKVRSKVPFRFQTNVLDSRFVSCFDLKGSGWFPRLDGEICSTGKGVLRLPGMTFTVEKMRIIFERENPYDPRIMLKARARRHSIDVFLFVTGSANDLTVELASVPPLPRKDLAVFVATGRLPGNLRGRTAKLGMLGSYLGGELVEYMSSGDDDGDSWTKRVKVEVGTEASRTGRESIRAEFKVSDNLYIQGERDIYSGYNLNFVLRWRLK